VRPVRRWHSYKKMSGGLMVHKATHRFDLVNWWLSSNPVSVYANGKREFYTPAMAKRLGLAGPHERCHTCPEKQACGFELGIAANRCFTTGQPVEIAALVKNIGAPDYPAMPGHDQPVPMPKKS
jgi:predicted dehydrogenase